MKNPDWNKKNGGEHPDGGILKPGERIDELQRNNYRIIQDPGRFCFGMDAVLLSGFARVKEGERVLDLGTGTGIIPILPDSFSLYAGNCKKDGAGNGRTYSRIRVFH